MNYFSRQDAGRQNAKIGAGWQPRWWAAAGCVGLGALTALSTQAFAGDSAMQMVSVLDDTPALMMHNSQGYLGVTIHDVDANLASALKLKEARGAEIVLIDHDAPACKAGLKVQDVIVQMNGQAVEGIEQLRKMLHDQPIGKTVNLVISRDGQTMNISVQLGDRAKLEQQPLFDPNGDSTPEQAAPVESGMRPVFNQQEGSFGNGFFGSITPNPLYVGAVVDPVGAQLADYFGVKNGTGLLVKSVDDNSPAGASGMKAGDVVLRVNGHTMVNRKDWLRAIHANKGKQVQVTVVRNRKEQTVTMWAGTAKNRG